jgi:metal-responsive CopG/Arc/MetJ family transcriptional regulator
MAASQRKHEIITFKVDEPLREAMKGIPNRSEFIRAAILSALDNICPLCKGNGILTPDQRKHWDEFAKHHALTECEDCHAVHLVCEAHTDEHEHHEHKEDQR